MTIVNSEGRCPMCHETVGSEKEIEKLEAVNKKLRECLEFYATNPDNQIWGIYEDDYGKRAKQTLKELNNEK